LIGSNRDEWRLFTALLGGHLDEVKAGMSQIFGEAVNHIHEVYTRERADHAPDLAWIDMQGDRVFRIPALRQAQACVRQGSPVWMYRFDRVSPAFGDQLGACHGMELPFVWNNLHTPFARLLLGDVSPPLQQLANRMHASWATFIRTGTPNTTDL